MTTQELFEGIYYEWTMCPSSSCNNIKTIIMWTKEGFHPTSNQEYRIIRLTFSFFNELATCLLLASQYYIMQMVFRAAVSLYIANNDDDEE
jgi:hypothetical protein